jgi:hypothetical protein
MTVYIAHATKGKDFSAANQYSSEIVNVFQYAVYPMDPPVRFASLVRTAADILASFSVEDDYLLLSGSPEAIAACSAILAQRHGHFMALKWDRENYYYYPIEISIERIRHGEETRDARNEGVDQQGDAGNSEGRRTPPRGFVQGGRSVVPAPRRA